MSNLKIYLIVAIVSLLSGFLLGKYLSRNADYTTKTTDVLQDNTNTHTTTKTTTVKQPDGKVETTTTTDTTVVDKKTDTINTQTQVLSAPPKINISLMAGADLHNVTGGMVYGAQVSKQFLGLNVGVYGLSNGTVGVLAGVSF